MLDPDNNIHIYCLQGVYVPRINKSLQEFKDHYNHHPMRSMNSRSPYQMFIEGMIANRSSGYTAVANFFSGDSIIDMNSYGVQEGGPSSSPDQDYGIIVDSPHIQLTRDQQAEFTRAVLSPSEDFGITQYLHGLKILTNWGY